MTTIRGLALLGAMLLAAAPAASQPIIQVFFDKDLTRTNKVCPGTNYFDTLYVAVSNANAFVSGAEYRIEYDVTEFVWVADLDTPPVTIGNTPTGIDMGWAIPQNAFAPFIMHKILILWTCDFCVEINEHILSVKRHPSTGSLTPLITDWPNFDLIPAVGFETYVCWIVATEETTWGQIKDIYSK